MKNNILSRRSFLGFFLAGGLISLLAKKISFKPSEKPARFWRRKNEA